VVPNYFRSNPLTPQWRSPSLPFALLFQLPLHFNYFRSPPVLLRYDRPLPHTTLTLHGNRRDQSLGPLCSRSADPTPTFFTVFPSTFRTPIWLQGPPIDRSAMSPKNSTPTVTTPCPAILFFSPNRTGNIGTIGVTRRRLYSTTMTEGRGSEDISKSIRCSGQAAFSLSTTPVPPPTLFLRIYHISTPRPAG